MNLQKHLNVKKQINYIDVKITFQDELENVNFVNGDWEINLVVSFRKIPFSERQKHKHTLQKALLDKVSQFNQTIMDNNIKQNNLNQFFKKNMLNNIINE